MAVIAPKTAPYQNKLRPKICTHKEKTSVKAGQFRFRKIQIKITCEKTLHGLQVKIPQETQ